MRIHFGDSIGSKYPKISGKPVVQLTYCNAVITMPKRLGNHIEVSQINAGRCTLGIPYFTVSKEFIEGEMARSSSDARETTRKVMYFERIKQMHPTRWPNRVRAIPQSAQNDSAG